MWISLQADNNSCDAILLLTEQNRNHLFLFGHHFQWFYDTGLILTRKNFAVQFVLYIVRV